MANRRMFSLLVIDTDIFLDLPLTAQALYFHLSMRADDDGFIGNAKKIRRMIGASEGDMDILIDRGFLLKFETGVCVVKHWRIHNYIQADRYNKTIYIDEKQQIHADDNKVYQEGGIKEITNNNQFTQNVSRVDTQVRLGKVRLGKVSLDNTLVDENKNDVKEVFEYFKLKCTSLQTPKVLSDKRERAIGSRIKEYGKTVVLEALDSVEASDWLSGRSNKNWKASIDWIFIKSNFIKIIEGNYVNKKDYNKKPICSDYDNLDNSVDIPF